MTMDQLRDGFRRLAVQIYSDELTRWRGENFRRKYYRVPELKQGLCPAVDCF